MVIGIGNCSNTRPYLSRDEKVPFVGELNSLIDGSRDLTEIPSSKRRSIARPLVEYKSASKTNKEAMAKAFLSGGYTMKELAEFFGVHYSTVSGAVSARCKT